MNPREAFSLISVSIPIVSALICSIAALIFSCGQVGARDRRIARILFYYFLTCVAGWFAVFVYRWAPPVFVYIQSVCYLAFLINSVLFYRLVFEVTRLRAEERFPCQHYIPPLIISLALLIWSFFVPFSIQLEIVDLAGGLHPDYKWYSMFFTSKVGGRMVFCILYTILGLIRLCGYRRTLTAAGRPTDRFWMRWVGVLIAFSTILFIIPMLVLIFSRNDFYNSGISIFGSILIVCLQVILITNVIRKNYTRILNQRSLVSNIPETQLEKVEDKVAENKNQIHRKGKKMTPEEFEDYFRRAQPHLQPGLKITDLTEVTGMGRNTLSAFVNTHFGMNFNTYVNQWRLREMNTLILRDGQGQEGIMKKLQAAGFGSYRSYIRAKQTLGNE